VHRVCRRNGRPSVRHFASHWALFLCLSPRRGRHGSYCSLSVSSGYRRWTGPASRPRTSTQPWILAALLVRALWGEASSRACNSVDLSCDDVYYWFQPAAGTSWRCGADRATPSGLVSGGGLSVVPRSQGCRCAPGGRSGCGVGRIRAGTGPHAGTLLTMCAVCGRLS
jgi:hypothetical protein